MELTDREHGRPEWNCDSAKYVMCVAVSMTGVEDYRIRRYEAAAIISPKRSPGGQRLFSDRDIARIRAAAQLEADGVNLKGVLLILNMRQS